MRFKDKSKRAAILVIACCLSLTSNTVLAEIEYGGSARLSDLFYGSDYIDGYLNVTDLNLRLIAEGGITESLSAEVHLVSDVNYQVSDSPSLIYGRTDTSRINRVVSAFKSWSDDDGWASKVGIDRLNARLFLPWADITIGRQAITLGTAYFWNPLDVFRPFDATTFDRDYKSGVDALRVDIPLNDFWSTTLVYAAGRDGSMEPQESHSLARIYGAARGFDFTLQISYEHRDPSPLTSMYLGHETNLSPIDDFYSLLQLGAGVSGEIGNIPIRLEIVRLSFGEASSQDLLGTPSVQPVGYGVESYLGSDSTTFVVGTGYRLSSELSVDLEHLYTGILDDKYLNLGFALQALGITRQASPHVTAVLVNYLAHPLIQTSFATLFDWTGRSTLMQANINGSISDEFELLLSGIMAMDFESPDRSGEFETYPLTLFAQLKGYF